MSMINVARLLLFTTNSSSCNSVVSTQLSLVGSDCLHTIVPVGSKCICTTSSCWTRISAHDCSCWKQCICTNSS